MKKDHLDKKLTELWGNFGTLEDLLQIGGVEGMRQKPWTIVTMALFRYAEFITKVKIDLTLQGDNTETKIYARRSQE